MAGEAGRGEVGAHLRHLGLGLGCWPTACTAWGSCPVPDCAWLPTQPSSVLLPTPHPPRCRQACLCHRDPAPQRHRLPPHRPRADQRPGGHHWWVGHLGSHRMSGLGICGLGHLWSGPGSSWYHIGAWVGHLWSQHQLTGAWVGRGRGEGAHWIAPRPAARGVPRVPGHCQSMPASSSVGSLCIRCCSSVFPHHRPLQRCATCCPCGLQCGGGA